MKTFKIMNVLFCLIILISCNVKRENTDMNYFDFDEVDYYHKDIIENDIFKEYEKAKIPGYDNNYLKIVHTEYPTKLNDTIFIYNMIKFGYEKNQIDKIKNNQINQIFSKNNCTELTTTSCVPIYRDIFVFKQKRGNRRCCKSVF
jgi:hypothetical protein